MELAGIKRNQWDGIAAQLEALRQISLENRHLFGQSFHHSTLYHVRMFTSYRQDTCLKRTI